MSARMMAVLGQFAPQLEIYSIDEAFLGLPDCPEPAALDRAREIVRTLRQWLGLPVSIGIGPTKVLAKVANRIAKKQKIPGGAVALARSHRRDQRLGARGRTSPGSCGGCGIPISPPTACATREGSMTATSACGSGC